MAASAVPSCDSNGFWKGWLSSQIAPTDTDETTVEYADCMHYNLQEGWYEFKCACIVQDGPEERNLSEWLGSLSKSTANAALCGSVVRAYLVASDGGGLGDVSSEPAFSSMVDAIAQLYARMVADDDLVGTLQEMHSSSGVYQQGFSTDCRTLAITED